MRRRQRLYLGFSLGLVLACAAAAPVLADPYPLPATAGDRTALEDSAPFLLPDGVRQRLITDRATLDFEGLPATFGSWDMLAFSPDSRFIFIPAEVGSGAGVFRYDTANDSFVTLMQGAGGGRAARQDDPRKFKARGGEFVRLDPATLTPWHSIITAEETTGGRLFEIVNPLAAPGKSGGGYEIRWRSNIPAVAHEGLRFDKAGTLYFVDENHSGSIYKFVSALPGNLSVGQTFVLSVDAFATNREADAAKDWNDPANAPYDTDRFGAATWVAITDARGKALTKANPFAFVSESGGRAAADEVKGTPYGRPEDIGIGVLANGNEALYVAITGENRVLSIELTGAATAIVRQFVNFDTINEATGKDVNPAQNDPFTDPGADHDTNFDDPDNIAVGAGGEIFILEDEYPGDIWKASDADGDGVAETIGLWASLGVAGSEPSGLIRDPNSPNRYIVSIMHPASGNDALWEILLP